MPETPKLSLSHFPGRRSGTGAETTPTNFYASDTPFGHPNHPEPEFGFGWSPSDPVGQETDPLKHEISGETAISDGTSFRGSSNLSPLKNQRLPFKESLGPGGCVSVFGGSIGALVVMGFLTFLWFGYGSEIEGRNATWVWRQLALEDWMTRAITLTALVLRIIVSAQSTVCTSMVAALILEKRFARKSNIASLSVLRAINGGPRLLIQLLLSSKSLALVLNLEFWLITALAIITLVLQFSSTILVSDLHDFIIVGNFNHTQVGSIITYEIGDGVYLDGSWIERPPVFAAFGEVQSQVNITPDANGFSSTGLVQRGFIPVQGSDNRTSVRQYEGNALVMYSKTTCMRPVIDAQYQPPPADLTAALTNSTYGRIVGHLDYGTSLRNAGVDNETLNNIQDLEGVYFDCSIPSVLGVSAGQSSFCLVGTVGGSFWPYQKVGPKWSYSDEPWSLNSSIFLVYLTDMDEDNWALVPQNQSILPSTPYEEWETYYPLPDHHLNISLCFSAFDLERKFVNIATSSVLREPIAEFSDLLVYVNNTYNVTDVQNYISIGSGLSPESRGILDMTILGEAEDGPPSSPANTLTTITQPDNTNITISFANLTEMLAEDLIYFILASEVTANQTFISCFDCFIWGQDIHANNEVLFNSIILSTQRPVQAMQSLMTIMAGTILDSYQLSLGGLQDAQLATTTTARIPGQCSQYGCAGFTTVITLLGVHLLCVAAITTLYLRKVCFSRFGNIWHAISQLRSDELREILQYGDDKSDVAIERALKRDGKDDFVKLKKSSYDGKIEVVKHARDNSYASDDSGPDDVDALRITRPRRSTGLKTWRTIKSTAEQSLK
jgi:hypothetical protein